ncbi:hypothetical protein RND81_10G030200 [Saponaria officinalis]|uniref:Uncharacterized protein n=1 Tax=Saponaria officinalis TaxID=3572 RepID=A0AAW1HXP7_SAPOF
MGSGAKDGDLVMLEDPTKLRKLASLILRQEEALQGWMTSEPERVKYLENCNDSYDGVTKLLNDSEDLVRKHKESKKDITEIVEGIHKYIIYFQNMSMQCIRNCSLRVTCIRKVKAHFADLVKLVEELKPGDVAATSRLAEEVTIYRKYMWEYTNSCRSASARSLSRGYSQLVKQEGLSFEGLVRKHKTKLGLAAEFEELEEVEQLRVYKSIIKESGRVSVPTMEKISASIGVAVLVASSALIAFDIFESEYKLESIVRNAFNVASEVGAFAVQLAVESALVAQAEFDGAGILVVAASGFIAGALAGLIFMAASGAVIDLIFSSGGKVEPHMVGMQFRKLEMPDGMAIANELSHEN